MMANYVTNFFLNLVNRVITLNGRRENHLGETSLKVVKKSQHFITSSNSNNVVVNSKYAM